MKKVNYKVGDIVELVDGVQYVYRGKNRKEGCYVYDPVLPNRSSIFFTLTEEKCVKYGYNIGAVPFAWKMDTGVTVL
nr:MAG TPA: RapA N-terminal Tudor like domain [Caudoviricetes sp.]